MDQINCMDNMINNENECCLLVIPQAIQIFPQVSSCSSFPKLAYYQSTELYAIAVQLMQNFLTIASRFLKM